MIRFYPAHTLQAVMKMPIRSFWVLVRNIDRIRSQEQLAALRIAICAQGGEAAAEMQRELQQAIGQSVTPDVVADSLDRKGLNELRRMT